MPCIDPGSRTLAAQDFRHIRQGKDEPVTDWMTKETKDTLLHGQMQDGLMKEPAVHARELVIM